MIIARRKIQINMDETNSKDSKYILVANVKPNLKVINVYGQPEKKNEIIEEMLYKVNRIRAIEPNKNIIIAGDFNIEEKEKSDISKRMWKKLKAMGI